MNSVVPLCKNDSGFSYDIIYLYLNLQINLEKKYINSRTMCVKATHLYSNDDPICKTAKETQM